MRNVLLLVCVFGIVSCASNKTGDPGTDAVIAHMSQGPKVMGKDWHEKFLKDGLVGGEYVAIGSATTQDLDHLQSPLRVNAEAQATARLLSSAPTDFKRIVQRAIDTLSGGDGATQESQIMITEVKSLTGMKSHFDDIQCVTTAVPSQNLKYRYIKECRVIVRVPAVNLAKAYDYTLDKKYGITNKSELNDILLQELNGNHSRSFASKQ